MNGHLTLALTVLFNIAISDLRDATLLSFLKKKDIASLLNCYAVIEELVLGTEAEMCIVFGSGYTSEECQKPTDGRVTGAVCIYPYQNVQHLLPQTIVNHI